MTPGISLQILGLAIVAGLGLIPAIVAEEKGRRFGWWWLYGMLFFPLAFPHAILAEEGPRFVHRDRFRKGAPLYSLNSYFGVKSPARDRDLGNDQDPGNDQELGNSWADLRMQQTGKDSAAAAGDPSLRAPSMQPGELAKSSRETPERGTPKCETPRPPHGNSRLAGWSFDDRDIRSQPDIDRPNWPRGDYGGIRFPFISIVSVLALTLLVTAGAYEIAAGGWSALSQQIAAIGAEIERGMPAHFDAAAPPFSAPAALPAVEGTASFPLPKPALATPVAAIAPAAGPSPPALPQQAAIPPPPATMPQPAPIPEKSVPKPMSMQKPSGSDSPVATPSSHSGTKSQRIVVSRNVIKRVQTSLSTLGYAPGRVDGKLDSKTRDAIRNYQLRMDIAATGVIDAQLLRSLGVKAYAKND